MPTRTTTPTSEHLAWRDSARAFFQSIRFRLTLWYSGLLAIFLLTFAGATYGVVARVLLDQQVMLDRATVQLSVKDQNGSTLTIELPGEALRGRLRNIGCPQGVSRPDPRCLPLTPDVRGLIKDEFRGTLTSEIPYSSDESSAPFTSITGPAIERTDVVRVGFEEESRDAVRRALLRFLFLAAPLLLGLSLLGGTLLAKRALAPIGAIAAAAHRIRQGHLRERIRLQGANDELKELADTFDDMIEELERLFEHEKRFAADASHELQTPLAVIRTSAEVALADPDVSEDSRESFSSIVEATVRISRIIDDLLLLASLEQRTAPRASVALRSLVSGVLKHLEPLAEQKGVTLSLAPGADVRVTTNADRLERAIQNLVENGLKYTERGEVMVAISAHRGRAEISIRDTGPGIPPEHLPHLFERFYRIDKGRSRAAGGTGLGLAIVDAAVTSLGGKVHVASALGDGTTFTLSLPVA